MPLVAFARAAFQLSPLAGSPLPQQRADSGRWAASIASITSRCPYRALDCPLGRGRGTAVLCRGGGSNFDNLIKQQGTKYSPASTPRDEVDAALDAFWLGRGVKEEAYRARLIGMGASLASSVEAGVLAFTSSLLANTIHIEVEASDSFRLNCFWLGCPTHGKTLCRGEGTVPRPRAAGA